MRPSGSDLNVILQIFSSRDYDLSWCAPYKNHIEKICTRIRSQKNVPLIIDAGANIGASTVWFAVNFPDCIIFAIEPEQKNFALLRKNTESYKNVTIFNAALWNEPGTLSLADEAGTGWGCRVEAKADRAGTVRAITIPELLAEESNIRPVIVKIDIEGAETGLLRNQTAWLDQVPLVIFEQHDNLWGWLGPRQGTGHAFFSNLVRQKREYLSRGENVLAFLHPEAESTKCNRPSEAEVLQTRDTVHS
jgi:FkbM family methyltransferase